MKKMRAMVLRANGAPLVMEERASRRTLSHVLRKVGNRPPDDRRCRAPATIVELVSPSGIVTLLLLSPERLDHFSDGHLDFHGRLRISVAGRRAPRL